MLIQAAQIDVLPGAVIRAGNGGPGYSLHSTEGGSGGNGGSVILDSPVLNILGSVWMGFGGHGGNSIVVSDHAPTLPVRGGDGGSSGVLELNGYLHMPFGPSPTFTAAGVPAVIEEECNGQVHGIDGDPGVNGGWDGGDACIVVQGGDGSPGPDASWSHPAVQGGPGVSIVFNFEVTGGRGGDTLAGRGGGGGRAEAYAGGGNGGKGGDGAFGNPKGADGGPGGNAQTSGARGGDGGNSCLGNGGGKGYGFTSAVAGNGGSGGSGAPGSPGGANGPDGAGVPGPGVAGTDGTSGTCLLIPVVSCLLVNAFAGTGSPSDCGIVAVLSCDSDLCGFINGCLFAESDCVPCIEVAVFDQSVDSCHPELPRKPFGLWFTIQPLDCRNFRVTFMHVGPAGDEDVIAEACSIAQVAALRSAPATTAPPSP